MKKKKKTEYVDNAQRLACQLSIVKRFHGNKSGQIIFEVKTRGGKRRCTIRKLVHVILFFLILPDFAV